MYHDYLRKHKRVTYSGVMFSGKPKKHIEDIDRQAEEMFFLLINQMAKAEGITEQLKSTNQIKWVGLMNNIRNRAEDIVFNELMYNCICQFSILTTKLSTINDFSISE